MHTSAWRTHRNDRVVDLERDADTGRTQSARRSHRSTTCHSLVLDALLDGDGVLLDIYELGGVLEVENKFLARRQCGRVKLKS